jgi:hypothetical protein
VVHQFDELVQQDAYRRHAHPVLQKKKKNVGRKLVYCHTNNTFDTCCPNAIWFLHVTPRSPIIGQCP